LWHRTAGICKKDIFYVLRTLPFVVVRYELVTLSLLTLIVIGLRDNIVRSDENE